MNAEADAIELDRGLASDGLRYYVKRAWPRVEPGVDYVANWHTDAVCEHLEAVARGDIKRLVINVPPGSGKSLHCCVLFPTWVWTFDPARKFITASFGATIARRDSLKSRQLLESDWWRARWGDGMTQNAEAWTAADYRNMQGGLRYAVTVSGSVTGSHGHIQIVDDPLKPLEIDGRSAHVTDTALDKASTWWRTTMSSRLVDIADSPRVIIMQRLHERDLAGEAIEAGYEHLCIPMAFDPSERKTTSIGWTDPRKNEGDLMFPERFPADALKNIEDVELGAVAYAAQYQQRPSPKGGNIFKEADFRYYTTPDHPIPGVPLLDVSKLNNVIQSWDCKQKDIQTGSWCVGQAWGQRRGSVNTYLLDQVRGRWGVLGTCNEVKKMSIKWPKGYKKLIENKANGPAVEETLRDTVNGIELVEPGGGKEERAHAAAPAVENGTVWLPHKSIAPWIVGFVAEATQFPNAKNDDQVDTMTQALYHFQAHGLQKLRAAMANSSGMI